MSAHLTVFELEEAAAGLPAAVPGHLEGCADCQQKVAGLRAAADVLRTSPQFSARLAEVKQQAKEKPIARIDPETGELTVSKRALTNDPEPAAISMSQLRWLVPAFALAAGFAVFVAWPRAATEDVRLKGSPMIRVVFADGRTVERAKPGQMVDLAVGSAGHAQGLVVSVDASGMVEVVWPRSATLSAKVPTGAGAHLEPAFEVTPGSLRLFAMFADGPFDASAATKRVLEAVVKAREAGKSPLEAEVPADPGAPHASVLLQVGP